MKMPFAKSFDGTQIYYEVRKGKKGKPVIVFIHGWAHHRGEWSYTNDFLRKRGHGTLTLDLRGHGRSGKPNKMKSYAMQNFAEDIRAVLKKEKVTTPVLIGSSMGGIVALAYYASYRDGKAIILADTPIFKTRLHSIGDIAKHLYSFTRVPKALQQLFKHHIKKWVYALKEVGVHRLYYCYENLLTYNIVSALKKVKVPLLLIRGSHDLMLNKDAIATYKKYGAVQKIIRNTTHLAVSEKPEHVSNTILEFLKNNKL